MRNHFQIISILAVAMVFGMWVCTAPALAAQHGAAHDPMDPRDFSGIWGGGPSDISDDVLPGQEIYLTEFGADRYRTVDLADSPANFCLPYGPTRALQSQDPKQIVQSEHVLVILFEQQSDFRIIYTDGTTQ